MYSYFAYGLNIQTDIAFPELTVHTNLADAVVRQGCITDRPPVSTDPDGAAGKAAAGGQRSWFKASPRESLLVWADVGAFLIRDGREILFDPAPAVDTDLVRQAVLGPAMGLLLQQRNLYPLHASAIRVAGRAVALAGVSGSGKSTLAAALHAGGHDLVTDDIAAVDASADPPVVYPGFPRFRMWPETVKNFGETAETLPRLHAGTEKRLVALTKGFAETPAPLARVYVIEDGPGDTIEPVPPPQGLLVLLGLCYNAKLIQAAAGTQDLVRQCARLASRARVFRLRRRRRIAGLSGLARMLEDHVAQKE